MPLVDNWRVLITRAWSMRLLYVVILIHGTDVVMSFAGSALPGPMWLRALLSFLVAIAAA